MKILVVAQTLRDAVNVVRMIRPDAQAERPDVWRAGLTEYRLVRMGAVFADKGFDRAVVFLGGDGDRRLMTWVQQIVAPKMGGRGCELVVIA